MTKNVQIIDGADNCTYSIYELTEKEFASLFPAAGQNIAFIEDVLLRLGEEGLVALLQPVWQRGEIKKTGANGIHGTLFYGLSHKKILPHQERRGNACRIETGWITLWTGQPG